MRDDVNADLKRTKQQIIAFVLAMDSALKARLIGLRHINPQFKVIKGWILGLV